MTFPIFCVTPVYISCESGSSTKTMAGQVGNTISDVIKSKKSLTKKNKILKKLKLKKKTTF